MNKIIASKNMSIIAVLGLVTATLSISASLTLPTSAADNSSEDNVAITIPVACTLVSSGNNSHSVAIVNGTYATDIGTTNLKVTCNDNQGFAIYAVGYTGDEIGATNSTKLVGTAASSNATIDTGTATGPVSGNDNSNWAMKLNTTTSPTPTYPITLDNSFNNYSAVPSSYTKVAHRDSGTDIGTSAVGSTLTTTYAAYISKLQYPDTYTGQVKYTLVHPSSADPPLSPVPCTARKICYQPSANDTLGTMGNQTPTSSQLTYGIPLWAPNFKRDGYGFAGWNDKYDYTGTFYGPNQIITPPADFATNGLSLYAVWVPSAGSLQDSSTVSTLCGTGTGSLTQDPNDGTADLSSVTALTDERDNNTYAIAKLADGKCWMIENLRLADKDSNNNDIILSSSNTHNPSLPLTNIYDSSTTSNHLSPTSSVAYDATTAPEGWCNAYSSACMDQSRLRTDNTTLYTNNTASSYSTSGNVYSYGNYYNWYSATAGQGTYSKSSGNTAGDICPAGWHLPTGKNTGEFYALNTAINNGATDSTASNKLRSYPNSFVYSGLVNGASVSQRDSHGYYWSSSANDNSNAYYLDFYWGVIYPHVHFNGKYYGWMVRCVSGV